MLGLFASSAINDMVTTEGLLMGGGSGLFVKQVVAVLVSSAYAFIFTYVMLILINFVTKVKVTGDEEEIGLDQSLHGEKAYDEGAL